MGFAEKSKLNNGFCCKKNSCFLAIKSKYFDFFFMNLTLKINKNLNQTIKKNSNLYKLELIIPFPINNLKFINEELCFTIR